MTPDGPGLTPGSIRVRRGACVTADQVAQSLQQLEEALGYGPYTGGDQYHIVVQDSAGNVIGGGVGSRPVNIILARVNQLGGIPAGNSTFPFLFVADLYGTSGLVTGDEGEAVNTSLRALLNNENVRLVTYDGAIWLADKVGENVIVATVKGTLTSGSVTKNDQYFYFEAQYPISGTLPESGNSAGVVINQPPSDYAANETIVIELTDGTVHGFRIWKMVENDDVVGSGGGGSYEAGVNINAFDLNDGTISVDEPVVVAESGSASKYSVIGFSEPVNDLSTTPKQIGWSATAPTQEQIDEGRWAIAKDAFTETVPAGYTMSAADTWVEVNVSSDSHTRARPVAGNSSNLVSDTQGWKILWREGGTGLQWAIVRMLDVSATASLIGALAIIKGEVDATTNIDTSGQLLDKDTGIPQQVYSPGVLSADPAPFNCAENPVCVTTHSQGALLVNPDGTPVVLDVSYCQNADGDFTLDIVDVLNPMTGKYIGPGEGVVVAGHVLEMETDDVKIRVFVPPTHEIKTREGFDATKGNIVIHNPDVPGEKVAAGWTENNQIFGHVASEDGEWEDTGPCDQTP